MRRLMVCMTAALTAAVVVTAAQAPAKIATLQDHVALMKSNAQANGALNKAIGSGAYADARMQVATLRQNLGTLETFWTEKKRDEAIKIVKEGLNRLEALDKAVSTPSPDQMAAQAAAKEFGGNTCGACHKQFREGDAQTGFKFREPGIL
jgi:cytochrome c556